MTTATDKPFAEHQSDLLASQTFRPQMVNDYDKPGPAIIKPSRIGWLIWPALVFFAAVSIGMLWWGIAHAAERQASFDMWLLARPVEDRPSIWKIGADYETRLACESAKKGVRVMAKGATVQCLPKN